MRPAADVECLGRAGRPLAPFAPRPRPAPPPAPPRPPRPPRPPPLAHVAAALARAARCPRVATAAPRRLPAVLPCALRAPPAPPPPPSRARDSPPPPPPPLPPPRRCGRPAARRPPHTQLAWCHALHPPVSTRPSPCIPSRPPSARWRVADRGRAHQREGVRRLRDDVTQRHLRQRDALLRAELERAVAPVEVERPVAVGAAQLHVAPVGGVALAQLELGQPLAIGARPPAAHEALGQALPPQHGHLAARDLRPEGPAVGGEE
eukprot:scaffold38588_cov69-Phaeocystis_antarctica.AAC.6